MNVRSFQQQTKRKLAAADRLCNSIMNIRIGDEAKAERLEQALHSTIYALKVIQDDLNFEMRVENELGWKRFWCRLEQRKQERIES